MAGNRTQRELALLVTGKDVSATKTLKGVGREMNKLTRISGKAGSNMARNIERGVLLGGTAAVGAIGYAVKAAMDFESSSASVRKTVDGNVQAILDANRALAMHTGMEVNNLNEISATAGALGVAKGDISAFTETVALLGVTTDDVTTQLGATSLGHLKTTLKLAGTDFQHVGNTLVYLGNNGASTEGQILAMTERVAGAAQLMGASTPQVLGWSTALANAGVEAELGGSAIQTFWIKSFQHVTKADSGLTLMAKTSGKTAAQFKKDFGRDATGTLAKFVVGLGKLSKADQVATLAKLGLTGRQMTRVMLALTGNTANLTDSLSLADKGWKENNAAQTEAAKRFQTTAAKVAILKANVNDAAITVGQELLPILADLSTDAVAWITEHRSEIHQFGLDLAGGIRDAVTWAKKLDWAAIGNALKAGADGAKFLVDAFMAMPPWVQQFLAVGFVANKFTGGAVQDVIGALGTGLIKGVLGMNAGVVNINAGVVNGGGIAGGAAGAAGAAGGGLLGAVKSAVKIGVGLGIAAVGSNVLSGGVQEGGLRGATQGVMGGAAMIGGGALAFGPLGAAVASLAAVAQTWAQVNEQNSTLATGISDTSKVWIEGGPALGDLQAGLRAIDDGINQIQANPLNVIVSGSALDELKAMRANTVAAIERQSHSVERGVASSERAEAIAGMASMAAANRDSALLGATKTLDSTTRSQLGGVISQVAASRSTTTSAAGAIAAATRSAGAQNVAAIRAKHMSVSVSAYFQAKVAVTAKNVQSQLTSTRLVARGTTTIAS